MTVAPDDLSQALAYLHDKGAPWASLGCVGDSAHAESGGYHEGFDDLSRVGRLTYDYSVTESLRDHHPTTSASAIDFAGADWWRPLTLWLVARCNEGDPDTEAIREIIYTPDGINVRRWDRLGIRTSGDDSHLWHTHISLFRDSEGRRGSFMRLLRRYFGDEVAPLLDTGDDEEMSTGMVPAGFAFGGPDGRQDKLIAGMGLGPVNGGSFGNKRCVLGLGSDFTPAAGVELRIAYRAPAGWHVESVTVKSTDDRWYRYLPDGCTKVTVGRVARGAEDQDVITKPDGTKSVTADAASCPVFWDLEFEKR